MQLRTLILSLAITASALPLASVESGEGEVQSINIARDTDGEVKSPQSVDIARRANSVRDEDGDGSEVHSINIARDTEGEVQSINIARDTDGEVHSSQSVDIARRANSVRDEDGDGSEVHSINIARDTEDEVHSSQSVDIARRADNVHATEGAEPDSVDIA